MQASDIDFLIIGAAKSATTWLQKSLQADPAIAMPDPELHYFSREYDRGHRWYLDQFPADSEHRLVGEKSNSYLDTPEAPARVHALLPHARLVVQLRNPVERAYSDYCMLYRRGDVGGDIETYLDPARTRGSRSLVGGLYGRQIEAYFDLYPRERLLVLFYEDMTRRPAEHLARVRAFLGLPAADAPAPHSGKVKDRTEVLVTPRLRRLARPLKPLMKPLRGNAVFEAMRRRVAGEIRYPPLSEDLRERLLDFYARDVGTLGALVERDLTGWLAGARTPTSSD